MTATTLWLIALVAGYFCIKVTTRAKAPFADVILQRLGALLFVGAGALTAGGFVGDWIRDGVDFVDQTAAEAGKAAFGSGAVWIVWAVLAVAWWLAFIPNTWFDYTMPDWLAMSGLLLPVLLEAVPGKAANLLNWPVDWGLALVHGIGRWFA